MHVGLIPDGNRRYAISNQIDLKYCYKLGFNNIKLIINEIYYDNIIEINKYNINQLTIFVCSEDNLIKRSKDEIKMIYGMIKRFIRYCKKYIYKYDIKINIIGNLKLIPQNIKNNLRKLIIETKYKNKYILNLAIAYDGRKEIIKACKKSLYNKSLYKNDKNIYKYLGVKSDIDIVIRTGYEKRMSGFFPYQTVYSEWFFIDKYWPEFVLNDFIQVIDEYLQRSRRYGK